MKLKICLLGLLCLFFQVNSRAQSTPKYLEVGDKMPDVEIVNIMNWKHKTAKLSDYKGQMIILDFWNTFCSGCIEGFPKLDSLQKQFKGKLQVLLVNKASQYEKLRNVEIVLDRMKSWSDQPFTLPIVFADKNLTKNFDFYGVPYAVWIAPDGTIAAIPDRHELTADNIAKVLEGEKVLLKHRIMKKRYVPGKATL